MLRRQFLTKPGLFFIWGTWRAWEGGRGLLKDKSNNYLMVLTFQLLLSLVALKRYCVCDWPSECGWVLGFSQSGWLFPGWLPQCCRTLGDVWWSTILHCSAQGGELCLFLILRYFSCFHFFLYCFLASYRVLFSRLAGGRGTLSYGLSTQRGEQISPLSAVQIASKPRAFNPLWVWAHVSSVGSCFHVKIYKILSSCLWLLNMAYWIA